MAFGGALIVIELETYLILRVSRVIGCPFVTYLAAGYN
jgi:hypothetical protein